MMVTLVMREKLVVGIQPALEYLELWVLELVVETEVLYLLLEQFVLADVVGQLVQVHNCWMAVDLAVEMSLG